jgi:superfamily II DNA helicase RecQ
VLSITRTQLSQLAIGFTRKKTLSRRKEAGEVYLHPRTPNTRPGKCHVSKPVESCNYSVYEVEYTNSLIKLQRLVEEFRKYKGSERKPDVEDTLIAKIIHKVWGYQPREIQAEVLRWLVFQREDCILTAKTSMGKSLPLQAVSVLVPNSVALIILPLDKIGKEQVGKLLSLSRKLDTDLIRPVFVNVDTKATDPNLFSNIKMMKYTHIFIGSEQAVSPEFGEVLKEPNFKTKVSLIAIDEAHLVSKWGAQFRQNYTQLSLVRSRLGQACTASWFACSATLDTKGLETLCKGAHFAHGVHHIRGSIDRTDISFAFQPIQKRKLRSFKALHYTIDECKDGSGCPSLQRIPKTIIFVDSKQMTRQAMRKLKKWIRIHCPECIQQQLNMAIRTYHRNTGDKEKERIYAEFSQPESQIRIIVATESLGLGIDLNNVRRVILYGLPLLQDLDTIIQCFGRAAQAAGMDGEALLLYEYWAAPSEAGINFAASQMQVSPGPEHSAEQEQDESYGTIAVDDENTGDLNALPSIEYVEEVTTQNAQAIQKKRKSDNERRAQLPEILQELIDASIQGRCIRKIINRYYEEWRAMESTKAAPPPKERCCSSCNPALIPPSEPPRDPDEDSVKLQIPRRWPCQIWKSGVHSGLLHSTLMFHSLCHQTST